MDAKKTGLDVNASAFRTRVCETDSLWWLPQAALLKIYAWEIHTVWCIPILFFPGKTGVAMGVCVTIMADLE